MSPILNEVLAANERYAATFGEKAKVIIPPVRHFALVWTPVLTRRSSRVWQKAMPLIRNAGGRASEDAIRSLVISHKLLGTREWFIIHHTDCGMELFTNETMPELLEKSLEAARLEEVKEATQVGAASAS